MGNAAVGVDDHGSSERASIERLLSHRVHHECRDGQLLDAVDVDLALLGLPPFLVTQATAEAACEGHEEVARMLFAHLFCDCVVEQVAADGKRKAPNRRVGCRAFCSLTIELRVIDLVVPLWIDATVFEEHVATRAHEDSGVIQCRSVPLKDAERDVDATGLGEVGEMSHRRARYRFSQHQVMPGIVVEDQPCRCSFREQDKVCPRLCRLCHCKVHLLDILCCVCPDTMYHQRYIHSCSSFSNLPPASPCAILEPSKYAGLSSALASS